MLHHSCPAGEGRLRPDSSRLVLRCQPKHDVEVCGQLADAGSFDGDKINDDGITGVPIANLPKDAVLLVLRLALDVALSGELVLSFQFDRKVNVSRASCPG
jgi:hypothetical protein